MTRRVSVSLFVAVATLLLGSVAAWACTNLATMNLSESAVQPGGTIDITGTSFETATNGGQPVELRWNAPDGAVLASAVPDPSGNIAATLTVPADTQPGHYVLIATQLVQEQEGHVSASGLSPAFGTPARAAIQVGSPAVPDAPQPAGVPAGAAETGSPGMLALTALLGLLGLGLFGAGLAVFVGEVRRRAVPARVEDQG